MAGDVLALHGGSRIEILPILRDMYAPKSARQVLEFMQKGGETIALDRASAADERISDDSRIRSVVDGFRRARWIPIAESPIVCLLCVDCEPGPTGRFGQVIAFGDTVLSIEYLADSLIKYLEAVVTAHEKRMLEINGTAVSFLSEDEDALLDVFDNARIVSTDGWHPQGSSSAT